MLAPSVVRAQDLGGCPFPLRPFPHQLPFLLSFLALRLLGPTPNTCQVTLEPGAVKAPGKEVWTWLGKSSIPLP